MHPCHSISSQITAGANLLFRLPHPCTEKAIRSPWKGTRQFYAPDFNKPNFYADLSLLGTT